MLVQSFYPSNSCIWQRYDNHPVSNNIEYVHVSCSCSCWSSSFYLLYTIDIFKLINIQLLTGFEDNSSFVWPEDGSASQPRRLRATDPLEGQTKLLLFEKPVYNWFVVHLHFLKIFLFTLSTHISIRCLQYPHPSSPRIWRRPWHCYVNITWLIEPMKIRPSVNS